ncbi:DJ-1/PfpI family protein [Motiliproteus coralliicola]|uniref:DJ-1/PfpI family protein n=1 Tax=Motiliproteus coralliicola TaxID=2283196 RepID=A0A369X0Q9_9GAMM|nr:DJ-1/PfpI family protein [Motiliproteus coralliicola]RDE25345.1 DJ-1/PfpI family protein [Motiliproteus coralliicola]
MSKYSLKAPLRSLATTLCMLFAVVTAAEAADKRIGILVYDGVLTSDVTAPLEVFGVASRLTWFSDYEAITVSVSNQQSITTEEGLKIGVDAWIGDAPELDVLIVTSSYDMGPLIENNDLIRFIQATSAKADWMSSNCSGAYLLAEAGLLDGKQATTWAGGEDELQKDYPAVQVQVDRNLVIDDGIVTSNGSLVSYQAALKLLHLMSSESKAQEVADALQYSRFSSQPF